MGEEGQQSAGDSGTLQRQKQPEGQKLYKVSVLK